ncbi:MAG: AAA family ATPase [Promethearchaeota archaeon]
MQYKIFPFSAFFGYDLAKMGLITALIDPNIGGILISGSQGCGKTVIARSLQALLPSESPFVDIPLGVSEDMLIGTLDLEHTIKTGEKRFTKGLLSKANGGILFIDEINLMQDHIIDLLLDVSESHFQNIEREGFSLQEQVCFTLIGTMDPSEGELRPQIQDRFGIELNFQPIKDLRDRAKITKRIFEFQTDLDKFINKFKKSQELLRQKIITARNLRDSIIIPPSFYVKASQLVRTLHINSQRAEIRFLLVARAIAAFHGHNYISEIDLERALQLVFAGKLQRIYGKSMNPNFLQETFLEIWHKIRSFPQPESSESPNMEKSSYPEVFRSSVKIGTKYSENPPPKNNSDLPEIENHGLEKKVSSDRFTNYPLDSSEIPGIKGGAPSDEVSPNKNDSFAAIRTHNPPIKMDLSMIFKYSQKRKRIVNYTGRGSRIKVLSRSNGRYVYTRKPNQKRPHSIAFDATIKAHYLHYPHSLEKISNTIFMHSSPIQGESLAIHLNYSDIHEKIMELRAPLSLYFIVDASASMRRVLPLTIKIIESVHSEGYKKKDKISVLSFQGREVEILQRPSVSFSVALKKLQNLQASSYTPLAAALQTTLRLISQETIKGFSIPIIIILSDLGANISLSFPERNISTREDFDLIADELEQIAHKIGRLGYFCIIMKPLKSFATRYLGVDYRSVQKIEKSFVQWGNTQIYEYDTTDLDGTIMNFKEIVNEMIS